MQFHLVCHFAIRQSFNPRLGWIWYAADLSPVLNCHYREAASLLTILLINCNRIGGGGLKTDPPLKVDDSLKTTLRCARINEFKIVWLAAHFGSFYYNECVRYFFASLSRWLLITRGWEHLFTILKIIDQIFMKSNYKKKYRKKTINANW